MNYLFVVAHPDDEVLGAGATIHKLVQGGHKVAVVTMASHAAARTDISDTLHEDQEEAMKILGVMHTYEADFPNIKMNVIPHYDLVQFVEGCIEDFEAEAIYTHHPSDLNVDHRVTSEAVQAAARLFQRREGIPRLQELCYMEVPSSTEWLLDTSANSFHPNFFVEIGRTGVDIKLKALRAYKGVMREYPHPRSEEALKGLAVFRGSQFGCNYAESFECVFRKSR